jgi:hypothetical protein
MAGTLTISTLSDGTNSTSSTNCISGSAKAWVSFNGNGSTSIRASYNVSSVTYNSAGNYTVNFTNAFADTNYAPASCGSSYGANYCFLTRTGTITTSACQFISSYGTGVQNEQYNSVAFFR